MQKAVLPSALKPRSCGDLKRFGRAHDGGYLASSADVRHSDVLVGLGINEDWSFERDFVAEVPCPVLGYDASISPEYFVKKVANALLRPRKLMRAITMLIGYWSAP